MKEVKFSKHALDKIGRLQHKGLPITREVVIQTIFKPDLSEEADEDRRIAQKHLTEGLVIRVVYREFTAFVLTITVYPGKKSRYEKN
ncbi:MAG: DUF4258 domain-containing protein [Cyanobacteria bacterium P01_A01_bin.105]